LPAIESREMISGNKKEKAEPNSTVPLFGFVCFLKLVLSQYQLFWVFCHNAPFVGADQNQLVKK
jgi:hypothetical protein